MSRLRKKHKNKKIGRIFAIIISFLLAVSLFFTVAFSGATFFLMQVVADIFSDLPDIQDYSPVENALTSKIYAADGTLIATFHSEENRELVSLEQVPRNLLNAVLSIEDERFYEHEGFDFEGTIRAFIINLQAGYVVQGATTISMGYIDNVYMPEERYEITYTRKLKEAYPAYQLEQIYTKDEIMEMYLNTVYFGEGAYGVQTAAKIYFNKNVEYLNIAECSTLAGLLRGPEIYSPYIDEIECLNRRNLVLAKMLELNHITREDYDKVINTPIITQKPIEAAQNGFAPYFVEYVKQELIKKYLYN